MQYRVRPAAQVDIDDIAEYLAGDRIEVGERFLTQVDLTIKEIMATPGLGAIRELINIRIAGLRQRRVNGFPNWLVFYIVTAESIDVIRVLHGARDLEHIFREEE